MTSNKRLIDVDGEISEQDLSSLKKCLDVVFDFFELDNIEVSIRLGNTAEVQMLNDRFRGLKKPTDVLSFPAPVGLGTLGDVIICVSIAEKQAAIHGHPLIDEICYLSIHGTLHLLGYKDEDEDDYIEMNNIFYEIIDKTHLPSHTLWHSLPSHVLENEG